MINPGDLRCPIIILLKSTTTNELNELVDAYTTVCNTWAKIAPLTSKEVYALGPGFAEVVTHKITIRYREGIAATMHIAYRNQTFTVQLVSDPDSMRTQLDLTCLENPA